jgi:hypothetical protein
LHGCAADSALYKKSEAKHKGKTLLLFRIWHPTAQVHELGLLRAPIPNSEGIEKGKTLRFDQFDTRCQTSKVTSFEEISSNSQCVVYKVKTETGSVYQAVFLL